MQVIFIVFIVANLLCVGSMASRGYWIKSMISASVCIMLTAVAMLPPKPPTVLYKFDDGMKLIVDPCPEGVGIIEGNDETILYFDDVTVIKTPKGTPAKRMEDR